MGFFFFFWMAALEAMVGALQKSGKVFSRLLYVLMYALSLPRLLYVPGRPGKNLPRFRSRERSAGMFIAIFIFIFNLFSVIYQSLLSDVTFSQTCVFSLEITGGVVILLNISSQSVINPIQKTPKLCMSPCCVPPT